MIGEELKFNLHSFLFFLSSCPENLLLNHWQRAFRLAQPDNLSPDPNLELMGQV